MSNRLVKLAKNGLDINDDIELAMLTNPTYSEKKPHQIWVLDGNNYLQLNPNDENRLTINGKDTPTLQITPRKYKTNLSSFLKHISSTKNNVVGVLVYRDNTGIPEELLNAGYQVSRYNSELDFAIAPSETRVAYVKQQQAFLAQEMINNQNRLNAYIQSNPKNAAKLGLIDKLN